MNKVVLDVKNIKNFTLHCPFTNEKLDSEDNSFEIYEGAGNYLFSMCEDCLFCDIGNNDEIEDFWDDSAIEAIEKFVNKYSDKNILVLEVNTKDETYYYGFLNQDNIELSKEEIQERFIKQI